MSAMVAQWTGFGERLNPVLVREVRQALRGKFFVIVFALTLIFAMVSSVGVLLLSEVGKTPGATLFAACSGFLGLATGVLVPVGAFQSLGAEHDDQTRDLLVLSNLSPGQIIRGKFFTFFLLALLFTISLAPFFVLSALLSGVDLLDISVQLGMSLLNCIGYTILAISLSSMAPNRSMRVLLLLILIVFIMMTGAVVAPLRFATGIGASSSASVLVSAALFVAVFGSFAYTLGCSRFTHPEENRSTPVRIHITATVFLVNILLMLFPGIGSGSFSMVTATPLTVPYEIVLLSLATFSFAALFFATEPSALGRRVVAHVPASRLRALLAFPFLPGGGKAVAWYLSNVALYLLILGVLGGGGGISRTNHFVQAGLFSVCATLVYHLLPSALFSPLTKSAVGRRWLVFGPFLLLLAGSVATEVYRAAFLGSQASFMTRVASPIGIAVELADSGIDGRPGMKSVFILYAVLAAVSLLLNSIRMMRESRELLQASRRRAEKLAAE